MLSRLGGSAYSAAGVARRRHRRDGGHGGGELREYAKGDVGVVRGDDRRALRPAGRHPQRRRHDERADVDDEHRRVHVERGRRRGARLHPQARAGRAAVEDARRRSKGMERHAPSGQYYNWYDHRTGAKLTVWPPTGRAADPDPAPRSTTAGSPTGLKIVENSVPQLAAPRREALRLDGLRLLLPAGRQPRSSSTTRPTPARRRAVTTRWSARAGSPTTSASPRARSRGKAYYGRNRSWPDTCDAVVDGDQAGRQRTRPTSACDVFEGALPYAGMRVVPSWSG